MYLHEYQSKQLLGAYGMPLPAGRIAHSAQEAVEVARALGGASWMVKAQVHAGARGKAGGVQCANSSAEVERMARALIGSHLVTQQTGTQGLPVGTVLVETPCVAVRELYLSLTIDRRSERVMVMAAAGGGMEIEQRAHDTPDTIHTVTADPVAGLQAEQCRTLAVSLHLADKQSAQFTQILLALYRLFVEKDAALIEINPLVVTDAGDLLALDAKIVLDDNALYRQTELAALRDVTQEDARESAARGFGLNYITLDGNIACMVNGAGLAMATMDLIKLHGGEPANFLDVGGGTTADKVAEAFKLILSDKKVRAILVNIFGGIVRCDLIAEGIIKAVSEVGITLPVVVRLEGNNAERARELLHDSRLKIITADGLTDAAVKAVASSKLQVAR
ncbi:MAG: ADP-forming succinate--CoA ligase subunit beta [Gammaproteobacteria bacterium]|nr:ADP-forming succinate--CoA ligase subunit beta [Gammaproteobacteria bacterium]